MSETCPQAELRDAWRGAAPAEGPEARLQVDAQGVPGLHVATDVLSSAEVEALRTVLGAHRAWVQVTYGAAGRYHDLTSAAERVDFCPAEAEAEAEGEGSRLEGSRMWPLDETHAELLRLVEGRLRAVFAPTGLWGGAAPADGPAAVVPNALQLTRVSAFNHIANHYDVRDMWKEGIATLAWSELPTEGELRGEAFSLCMQLGAKKAGRRTVQVPLPPGSAYVLTGASQGATRTCSLRHVGRAACSCCWTHGVTLSGPARVSRQSLTLRALADDESDSDSEAEGGGGASLDGLTRKGGGALPSVGSASGDGGGAAIGVGLLRSLACAGECGGASRKGGRASRKVAAPSPARPPMGVPGSERARAEPATALPPIASAKSGRRAQRAARCVSTPRLASARSERIAADGEWRYTCTAR
mmetsp:Transcript_8857/g.29530  ORF Transcript_8857/g.29530 Transcript_8857/m.29530 type:complete len:415 (-) Transcript_8857:754-1998(-)